MTEYTIKINNENIIVNFKNNWSEIYIEDFENYMEIQKRHDDVLLKLQEKIKEFNKNLEKIAVYKAKNNRKLLAKANIAKKRLAQQSEKLDKDWKLTQVEMIQIFSDCPVEFLKDLDPTNMNLDTDKNFNTWIARLNMLVTTPLPATSVNEFILYDGEIPITYKILDIWEQTTLANKDFRNMSNDLVNEINKGNYSNLPSLCAYVVIEGTDKKELDEIRKDPDVRSYTDRYSAKLKQIYDKNLKTFTTGKVQLDVATMMRVANFFFTQVEEMIDAYPDVLKNRSNRIYIVELIIEALREFGTFVKPEVVLESVLKAEQTNKNYVKIVLNELTRLKIVKKDHKNRFKLLDVSQEIINSTLLNFNIKEQKTPKETKVYFEQYGFDSLVSSVSKWLNKDGAIVREYNLNSLWLGRYVDFLDKAKQWIMFRDSESAINRLVYNESKISKPKSKSNSISRKGHR